MLAELDSNEFAVREASSRELALLGADVVPVLRRVLEGKPSAEVKRQIEALLGRPRTIHSAERLRTLRAIQLLEHLGSDDARRVLKFLAGGAADTLETQEAAWSLERLGCSE